MELEIEEPLFFRLTFDGLLRRTLLVIGRGAPLIFGTAAVMMIPSWLLLVLLPGWAALGLGGAEVTSIVAFLLDLIMTPLTTGVLVYSVFKLLRGEGVPNFLHSVTLAGKSIISLLLSSFLSAICIAIGTMLCLIPGFWVMAGLAVIAPAVMVERVGAIEALNRSWELTEGYRWPIFCMLVLITLVSYLLAPLLVFGVGMVGMDSSFAFSLFEYLASVVGTALTACAAGVAYHDLRLSREELNEDELLAVFE